MGWDELYGLPPQAPDRTLSYGTDPLQVVDLWLPAGAGPHPVIVMIHGGCWQTRIATRDIMNWIAADLRGHGVAVWNVEYRGVDRGGGYPGTYQDVGAAADMLRDKAKELGLDLKRSIAIGHSAGGHLALWLAARPALKAGDIIRGAHPMPIEVAISQGGLPDLDAAMKDRGGACGTDAPAKMAGGHLNETSPPAMPVGRASQILFNNDRDRVAPPALATAYAQLMTARGVVVQMIVTPDEGHVELVAPTSASWAKQREGGEGDPDEGHELEQQAAGALLVPLACQAHKDGA
jgi:acetyl esterase/lipase